MESHPEEHTRSLDPQRRQESSAKSLGPPRSDAEALAARLTGRSRQTERRNEKNLLDIVSLLCIHLAGTTKKQLLRLTSRESFTRPESPGLSVRRNKQLVTEHNTWSRFRPRTEQHCRLAGENSTIKILITDALKEETGQRGGLQRDKHSSRWFGTLQLWSGSRNRRLSVEQVLS